jgi:hypothetical protein
MKMYRTNCFGIEIEEHEIAIRAKKTVTLLDGRKQPVIGTGHVWHDTWDDAWEWLWAQARGELGNAEQRVARAKKDVDALIEARQNRKP